MAEQRSALVTGGAGGIGAAICRLLAADGMRVAACDLAGTALDDVANEINGTPIEMDITDPESVARGVRSARNAFGPVSVLVNCAGWDELKPLVETDDVFMGKVININLVGPIRVTRTVLPDMLEAGYGRIVNIASDAGRVGSSLEAVYSGAKGGVIAFTKTVAREVARSGVTANTVCPGPTDTPLLSHVMAGSANAEKVIAAMTKAVPMRRLGTPEDVAPAVAFLASEAAGYITGQTLSVSGGLTMAG